MEEFCAELHSGALAESVCRRRTLGPAELLFNPEKEREQLLRQWLQYRGLNSDMWSTAQLPIAVTDDMRLKGNSPPFQRFTFDPSIASENFMGHWLSWHGLGSADKKPRKWWENLVRSVQKMQKKLPKMTFSQATKLLYNLNAHSDRLADVLKCVHMYLETYPQPALVSVAKTAELVGNPDRKKLLADLLGASAVLLPVVWNNREGVASFANNDHKINSLVATGSDAVGRLERQAQKEGMSIFTELGASYLTEQIARAVGLTDTQIVSNLGAAVTHDLMRKNKIPVAVISQLIAASGIPNSPILNAAFQRIIVPALNETK